MNHHQTTYNSTNNTTQETPRESHIQDLVTAYKRAGHSDNKRDELLEEFKKSEAGEKLVEAVKKSVNLMVEADPQLLTKDKGQAVALMTGRLWRGDKEDRDLPNVHDIYKPEIQKICTSEELSQDIVKTLKDIDASRKDK